VLDISNIVTVVIVGYYYYYHSGGDWKRMPPHIHTRTAKKTLQVFKGYVI